MEPKEYNIYDAESLVFIDPMFIIDTKNNSCLTLKFHLKRYIKTVKGESRLIQSLISRQKNK